MLRRRSIVVGTVCVALATAAGCGGDDSGSGGGESTPAPTQQAASGKELFSTTCGGCHTLADAGTTGAVGPNLDDLGPDHARVLNALRTGPGAMPENLLVGEEAEAVADYVSSSAGQ
ncbi:MAG TPA: cytochrome c [Solirubrobacteraceae bacterium]|nr:cytochrome c [Solirubrobacteraceae bacterium]